VLGVYLAAGVLEDKLIELLSHWQLATVASPFALLTPSATNADLLLAMICTPHSSAHSMCTYLYLIHGHGRNRDIAPGFVNTNTGYFGLQIRHTLRHDKSLWRWIHHPTLNCEDMGVTSL